MQKLVQGIHNFQRDVFRSKRELFQRLAGGQRPAALFICCSDSRINPNLLTQTEPGDIFVLRNAGNIIPPSPEVGGELATIEFAINGLGIEDIVVCGHSDCGAMKGLLAPQNLAHDMPHMCNWLRHASRTKEIVEREYTQLGERERLTVTVEENVIVQLENLRTHNFIEERLKAGHLKLHGWVYKFETGQVFGLDGETFQFLPIGEDTVLHPAYPRESEVTSA